MGKVVLDTSVIVKAVLKPSRWLPRDIYEREVETHEKSRLLIRLVKEKHVEVFIPFVALVEVAGVLTRLASSSLAREIVESLKTSENYHIVHEEEIRDHTIEIALEVGSSGFDTYFIAIAKMFNAVLITDDEPMAIHAKRLGVDTILIRKISTEELRTKINTLAKN
ncbi:MAG: VapC toxin family PIN domain ribonuclease [Desulfurococcales archaeon ex4484_42]|nr:MAG: VapC toxin family PIN domain ribonuclease [Desulfurococcales archaeon ex4484_42]